LLYVSFQQPEATSFMIIHVFSVLLSSFPLLGGSWGGGRCPGFCEYRQFFRPIFPVILLFIFCYSQLTFLFTL